MANGPRARHVLVLVSGVPLNDIPYAKTEYGGVQFIGAFPIEEYALKVRAPLHAFLQQHPGSRAFTFFGEELTGAPLFPLGEE